jgi:hypothetical protein
VKGNKQDKAKKRAGLPKQNKSPTMRVIKATELTRNRNATLKDSKQPDWPGQRPMRASVPCSPHTFHNTYSTEEGMH